MASKKLSGKFKKDILKNLAHVKKVASWFGESISNEEFNNAEAWLDSLDQWSESIRTEMKWLKASVEEENRKEKV